MKTKEWRIVGALAGLLTALALARPAHAGILYAYWADAGSAAIGNRSVGRTDAAGTTTTNLYSGYESAADVAIDSANGMIYWTRNNGANATIYRGPIGGGTPTALLPGQGQDRVWDISLDLVNNKMYWTNYNQKSIMRSNLDGSVVETLLTSAEQLYGIEVDPATSSIYWTTQTSFLIQRANLNVTPAATLASVQTIASASGKPANITVDPINGVLYWAQDGNGRIVKHGATTNFGVAGTDVLTGLTLPRGIAIDAAGGQLYFTDPGAPKAVFRVNTDGTGLITLSSLEANSNANGIDLLLPEPASAALLGLGGLMVVARRRTHG